MSYVTTLTLVCQCLEEKRAPAFGQLQEWLRDESHGTQGTELEEVSEKYPGTKGAVYDVWGASFNGFHEAEDFVKFAQALKWYEPAQTVMILQTEDNPIQVLRWT